MWCISPQHITGTRTSERSDRIREKRKTTWLRAMAEITVGYEVQVSSPACCRESRCIAQSHSCCSHRQLCGQEVVILLGSLETA